LAGVAVGLSLLVGAVAGIVAYRHAATSGKPPTAAPAPAPVAALPPPVAAALVSSQAVLRRVDSQFDNGNLQLTLALDQPVPSDTHRLKHPDRVYVDLHGARLAPELSNKTLFMNQHGVADIRLAQTQPDTVRVVLDLERRFDYSVTKQTNPPGLVLKLTPHVGGKRPAVSSQPKKTPSQ
jgi:N-acetylmuramoyl-L-alanine amidase